MNIARSLVAAFAALFASHAVAQEQECAPTTVELAADEGWSVEFEAGPPAALVLGAPDSRAVYRMLVPGEGETRGRCVRTPAPEYRLEWPAPAPAEVQSLAASSITGPRQARLGRVAISTAGGETYEALVALHGTPAVPTLVWAGRTGLGGDVGERSGWRIDAGDVDGDGADDVLVGRIAEAATICGVTGLPLLHRRAYDWDSGTLRPVSAPRPGLDADGAEALAPVEDPAPGCPGGREGATPGAAATACPVLLPTLSFRAASSSYGDGGDPLQGAAPTGLEDLDGRTGWAEGVGGAGKLEFATARAGSDAVAARWLAVRATDDSDPTAPKTRGRPRSLLVLDGAGHRWTLSLRDDAASRAGAVAWFELPEPPGGGCVTVALLESWPATSADGRRANVTWLSDFQAFASLELPRDAEAVRALLDDDSSSVGAERLFRALGPSAVSTIAEVGGSLGPVGAGRAATFLLASGAPEAAGVLGPLLGSADASVARAAREAVMRHGAAATPVLVALLRGDQPAAREVAVELAAAIGGPEALPALLDVAREAGGTGGPAMRPALAGYLSRAPDGATLVLAAATEAAAEGRHDAAVELLRVVPLANGEVRAGVAALVVGELEAAGEFALRYHLVRRAAEVLAAGEPSPAEALLRVATSAAEPELRTEAALGLAEAPGSVDLAPLLGDDWPGVRAAAAMAIGRRGRASELQALAARFAIETWPLVRGAAAVAFLRGEWPGDDVARRLLADPSADVRERVVLALDDRADESALGMLAEVVEEHRERLELRQRALAALTRVCWADLKPLVVRMVEWSIQPGANRGDQALALDAIRALGTAGPSGIRSLLEEIVREAPVAPMLAAAIRALGDLGEADARTVLEPYLRHIEPSVGEAAQAALEALERGRPAPRCEGEGGAGRW
ncbi:MAG: HEAT repeat domain-containing protein [Deltaproteobacteria bacterium]|nr:HEAT repeat domain-containing protein [Deltaproteobacteria bacterium]